MTLDRGLKLLEEETDQLAAGQALPGEIAFRLYDTYGFPLDLTEDILQGPGAFGRQCGLRCGDGRPAPAARKAWSGSGEAATDEVWFDIRDQNGATEFLGYDTEDSRRAGGRPCRGRAPVDTAPVAGGSLGGGQPDAVLWRIRWPDGRCR